MKLAYYEVPENHMTVDLIYPISKLKWKQFVITDSQEVYKYKSFFDRFKQVLISDDLITTAQIMWHIRDEQEEIVLIKIKNNVRTNEKNIKSADDLIDAFVAWAERDSTYLVEYYMGCELAQLACGHYYGTMNLYVNLELKPQIERVVDDIATKGDFYQYELGGD